jgi:hypothetical protein
MVRAIKDRVTVGAGGRIEIARPDLPEGTQAEVIILVEEPAGTQPGASLDRNIRPLTSFIGKCRGTYGNTPEEADRYLRELRDEWDR